MAVTSQLPLEMQLLLGRSLAVGRRICWLQPACTERLLLGLGACPASSGLLLFISTTHPCFLPTASEPHAPLPITPDPWQPGMGPGVLSGGGGSVWGRLMGVRGPSPASKDTKC